jgi:hypothetical protein
MISFLKPLLHYPYPNSFFPHLYLIRPIPRESESNSTPQDSRNNTYIRPIGPELVSSKHPSCSNLPPTWNYIHDRFIAYLATHAPLDKNGKIPRHEETRESEEIVALMMERFPELGRYHVSLFSASF